MAWLGDLLGDRLELRSSVEASEAIIKEARHDRLVEVMRMVEADRRATVDKVIRFLAHHQDAQGVDTWSARRALSELLAEEGGGDG